MSPGDTSLVREFPDNALAQVLFGPHNANLDRIESHLGVGLDVRGNTVTISGTPESTAEAARVLDSLYQSAR